ncbi:hypothetical protein CK203_110539 [Vitis vinifera]|uniref:Uncharacterized protein n=1 Tax=Vitis vinifera TaxID=29760 RepID=A0A438CSJ1_VITVI|nr:hypothetical protein CK203_110539 [Vitis vinifera]
MATATPNLLQPPNFTCVKSLSESSALTSIPSTYTFTTDPNQLLAFEPQHSIPSSTSPYSPLVMLINAPEPSRTLTKPVWNGASSWCGTSFNARVDQILFWRDFLKLFVHPQFHSPSKPAALLQK